LAVIWRPRVFDRVAYSVAATVGQPGVRRSCRPLNNHPRWRSRRCPLRSCVWRGGAATSRCSTWPRYLSTDR